MVLRSSRMGISSMKRIRKKAVRTPEIRIGDIVQVYTWNTTGQYTEYQWVLAVCVREYMNNSFDCFVLESKETEHIYSHNIRKVSK